MQGSNRDLIPRLGGPSPHRHERMTEERWSGTKMQKRRSANNARFRPGRSGACEAQLWSFTGPPEIPNDANAPEIHWVAAESLDAALRYMRRRFDDFTIVEARFLGMIPLLSGSPLD